MSTDIAPLLADQGAADLAPLRRSHEADQLETELKALFMAMFDQYVRPGLDAVETVGAPHLGDVDQLERAVKVDGIALQRMEDVESMRYLHKAFRALNPKRGLHLLRCYVDIMFPGLGVVSQFWQKADATYPEALVSAMDEPDVEVGSDYYLTSRIGVEIAGLDDVERLVSVGRALRSVMAARFVLDLRMLYQVESRVCMVGLGQFASLLEFDGAAQVDLVDGVSSVSSVGLSSGGQAMIFYGSATT